MGKAETEWVIAYGLYLVGKFDFNDIKNKTMLPVPFLMSQCECGKVYFSICPDCTYRNSGRLVDSVDEKNQDLVDVFQGFTSDCGFRLQNQLNSMRIY